jgi:hypothetical protein
MDAVIDEKEAAEWSKRSEHEPIEVEGIKSGFAFFEDISEYKNVNGGRTGRYVSLTPGYTWRQQGCMAYWHVSDETTDEQARINLSRLWNENIARRDRKDYEKH